MPIYMVLDGFVLIGNGNGFGYPLTTIDEGVAAVPDALGQFKPMSLTFAYTTGLPELMKVVANPRTIPGAVINFTDVNNLGQETSYMRLLMTNVTISKVEFNCGATGQPFVAMDLVWQTMTATTIGNGGVSENFNF